MRQILSIARTELRLMFFSPIAWIILVVLAIQSSFIMPGALDGLVEAKLEGSLFGGGLTGTYVGSRYFMKVSNFIYLYIPLLTMGIISKEISSGSIKLLYSSPISDTQIILGKFLSLMIYNLAFMGVVAIFALAGTTYIVNAHIPEVIFGLIGLYLLMCTYSAIGLFISSITSYQIVAAIATFALLFGMELLNRYGQDIPYIRDVLHWSVIGQRVTVFIRGLITSENVIYFVVFSSMFLAFTVVRMWAMRQKVTFKKTVTRYLAVILATALIGYITSRPVFNVYCDITENSENQLTQGSKDVIDLIDERIDINSFVNGLDTGTASIGDLSNELIDMERFDKYLLHTHKIDFNYHRYYDTMANVSHFNWIEDEKGAQPYREKGLLSLLGYVRTVVLDKKDSMLYMTGSEVAKIEDVRKFGMSFFRTYTTESGKKISLTLYNDNARHPAERELTSNLRRMVIKPWKVGFLEGHGERTIRTGAERAYSLMGSVRGWRKNLYSLGYDVTTVNLKDKLADDIGTLIISDMRTPLTEQEEKNLDEYIARGGNILIANENKRQDNMNPINEKFGVTALPGVLVSQTTEEPDLIFCRPTEEGAELSRYIKALTMHISRVVVMTSAVHLDYSKAAEKGFNVVPLLVTHPDKYFWNEIQTTDFIDGVVSEDSSTGEIGGRAIPTMLALSREMNGKEQRIVMLADADCISNFELSALLGRKGMGGNRNYLIHESANYWLSNNTLPVTMSRPPQPDNDVKMGPEGARVWKVVLKYVVPSILLILSIVLWLRRRGK